MAMPYVEKNALRLWYDSAGTSGTPVVLIMGFGALGQFWEPQLETLSRHHPVLWFDHRGIGRSSCPRWKATTADMAGDVILLMDRMGWSAAHIVGMSMGGMVAQEVALRFKERVRSLTLMATTPLGIRGGLSTPRAVPLFFRAFLGTRRMRKSAAGRILFTRAFLKAGGDRRLEDIFDERFNPKFSLKGFCSHLSAVLSHWTERRLHELKDVRTLVLWGEEDLLIRPRESERLMQKIPHARRVSYKNTSHGVNWQHQSEVNGLLLEHFQKADAERAPVRRAG